MLYVKKAPTPINLVSRWERIYIDEVNLGSLSIGDITGLKTVVSVCVSHIYKCGQPQYRRYYRIEDSGVCLC